MFAGLDNREFCKCMNCYNDEKSDDCDRQCQDYTQTKYCGGDNSMNVYQVAKPSQVLNSNSNESNPNNQETAKQSVLNGLSSILSTTKAAKKPVSTANRAQCNKPSPNGKCYSSADTTGVTFPMPHFKNADNRAWCRNKCKEEGKKYAGLDNRESCKCMDCYNDQSSDQCNRQCQDYTQTKFCGGDGAMNVYET